MQYNSQMHARLYRDALLLHVSLNKESKQVSRGAWNLFKRSVCIYIYILSFLDDIDAYIIQLEFDKY